MLGQPIPAPQHRMPPGYDCNDTTGPDIAHLIKLRDGLLAAIMQEMRGAGCYVERALGDWAAALDDLPDLETAMQNDRECV